MYRPDLAVYDKENKDIIILEITVIHDKRPRKAINEKASKYNWLKVDLYKDNKSKGFRTTTLLVVAVGALGCASKKVVKTLHKYHMLKECLVYG